VYATLQKQRPANVAQRRMPRLVSALEIIFQNQFENRLLDWADLQILSPATGAAKG
jgi:hypothetical protein